MIDMHLHTFYSDGTMSPKVIVARASERGIKTIAITDHDGIDGIKEALEAGKRLGVKVIPGIELSTVVAKEELNIKNADLVRSAVNLHILGYEIDINNEALNKALAKMKEDRKVRNSKLLSAFNSIGVDIKEKDLFQREEQSYVGKPNFALALVERGYIRTTKEASTPGQFLRHPAVRKVHREKIHVRDAISLINNAGGYSVLAHPLKIKFSDFEEPDKKTLLSPLLDKLLEWGLSGLECYYSTHNEEESAALAALAKNKGLLVTSGSDFHGPEFDLDIDIGVTNKFTSKE